MAKQGNNEIGPETKISLATARWLMTLTGAVMLFFARAEYQFAEIRAGVGDRWPKRAMRAYAVESERLNLAIGFKAPDVDEILRRVADIAEPKPHIAGRE